MSTFLRLKNKLRKGQNGCILVVGGSNQYTGAPIFAAKSAIRSGADLIIVAFGGDDKSAIKSCYECVVVGLEPDTFLLSKITCCVIGPGLSILDNKKIERILNIVKFLEEKNIPFIIDGDGIRLYKAGYFKHLKNVVVTPNYKEKNNLPMQDDHYYIFKGQNDIISHNNIQHLVFEEGSKKRCGGQGDILAGILSTALSISNTEEMVNACISSCRLMRVASFLGFKKFGYGLIASDIIEMLPFALEKQIKND